MDKTEKDASVLAHIQKLVAEEHRLLEHPSKAQVRPPDVVERYEG